MALNPKSLFFYNGPHRSPCGNCSKHTATCKSSCDLWKQYQENKDKEYAIKSKRYRQ